MKRDTDLIYYSKNVDGDVEQVTLFTPPGVPFMSVPDHYLSMEEVWTYDIS